jgi:sugar phosphate isomerase/epimerase
MLRENMMRLGIFETVFGRPTLREAFEAVRDAGYASVQFDFASAGIGSQPSRVPPHVAQQVRDEAESSGVRIASVSGTFNMIHPDRAVRESGLTSLQAIASTCSTLGCDIVTLCTGTRDTQSMWRGHPDNGSADAWTDLLESLASALAVADRYDVRLVVEPEPANVARDADRARRLLDEIGHPRLKIVLDPANILAGDRDRSPEVALDHAFDLLGDHIILAHAKDLDEQGKFCAAGTGIVPWDHYRRLLQGISYAGDVIFHTLTEEQAKTARAVLAV